MIQQGKKKADCIFTIISLLFLFITFYFNLPYHFSDNGDKNFDTFSNGLMLADLSYFDNFKSNSSFEKVIVPGTTLSDGTSIKSGDDLYIDYINHNAHNQKDYVDYNSNIVAHRYFYHFMDKILPLSNQGKIKILYLMNAFLMAIMVTTVLLWFKKITNTASASVTLALLGLFAPDFCMYGKNLYWVGWSLFLPMVVSIQVLKHGKFAEGKRQWLIPFAAAFFSCFLKQAFYFEFVTSVMIAMMVPYVYYCVEKRYGFKKSLGLMIPPAVGAILSFFAVCFVKVLMLVHDTGNFKQSMSVFLGPIAYRVLGNSNTATGLIQQSAKASLLSVFKLMLLKPALSVKSILFIAEIFVILVLGVITIATVFYGHTKELNHTHFNACLVATWVSLLAPLSWFILAKPHAFIHNHYCSILWYLPFTPFVILTAVYSITCLLAMYRRNNPKKGQIPPNVK